MSVPKPPKTKRCVLGGLSRLPCTRRACEWWVRSRGLCKFAIKAEALDELFLTNAENSGKTS